MKLVVCVDDDMGILFNKRRQSQDSVVRDRVVAKLQNANLYMSEYSGKQFELIQDSRIVIGEDFFEKAGQEIIVSWRILIACQRLKR